MTGVLQFGLLSFQTTPVPHTKKKKNTHTHTLGTRFVHVIRLWVRRHLRCWGLTERDHLEAPETDGWLILK